MWLRSQGCCRRHGRALHGRGGTKAATSSGVNDLHALFADELPPNARAVVSALQDARRQSTAFLLSCGILPEINESCTEGLHDHVHALSEKHLERQRIVQELRTAIGRHGISGDALDDIEHAVTSLVAADTAAAYLFGLAAGLGLGSLDRRLDERG